MIEITAVQRSGGFQGVLDVKADFWTPLRFCHVPRGGIRVRCLLIDDSQTFRTEVDHILSTVSIQV